LAICFWLTYTHREASGWLGGKLAPGHLSVGRLDVAAKAIGVKQSVGEEVGGERGAYAVEVTRICSELSGKHLVVARERVTSSVRPTACSRARHHTAGKALTHTGDERHASTKGGAGRGMRIVG
jgi:hypothetical protein